MARLNAYLTFDGNCGEAMNFYKDCLGGELELMPVEGSQMAAGMPDKKDKIMHSMLKNGEIVLMASDMMGPEGVVKGNNVALCLICDAKEEIERLFSKLSEGGKVGNSLKEEFFGTYGDLTDKYGFNWMFQFGTGEKK